MAHYNLIKNGILETNTASGTGNTTFSGSEMVSLYDGNTTSSGISLTTANTVYFEIDLFNRILLDELSISFSVSGTMDTALSGIDFYYKDNLQDEYTLLDKAHDASQKFYATNLITHFAPRYIRIISDSVEGELHELIVYNDDYVVAFGDDGTQDEVILDEFVEYTELQIFNNNHSETTEVDAYAAIDYEQDNDFGYYLTLSSSPDGEYKGILDGVGIDNENIKEYSWGMGLHDGTQIVDNALELKPRVSYDYNVESSWSTVNPLSQQAKYGFGLDGSTDNQISVDCWDWDGDATIYAMARLVTDDVLKLYKYSLEDNEWSFINMVDVIISVKASAMIYLDEYLYILVGKVGVFGRYDLSNPINNWEVLATASNSGSTKANQGMCSDRQRYIYTASCRYDGGSAHSFARYDTVSGTWTNMNSGFYKYYGGGGDGYNITLSHDKERDCLYFYNGRPGNSGGKHIQRYDIPTDTWDPYWYTLVSTQLNDMSMGYWNHYYCWLDSLGDKVTVINFLTLEEFSFDVSDSPTYHSAHLMCIEYEGANLIVRCGHDSTATPGTIWFYDISPETILERVGEYTSPVFSIGDAYKSAYLHVDNDTTTENKVSYSDGAANTVMVKSNDTSPRPFAKIFAAYQTLHGTYNEFYLIEGDLISGELIQPSDHLDISIFSGSVTYAYYVRRVLFDHFNLELVVQLYETHQGSTYYFYRFRYSNGNLYYKDKTSSSSNYNTGTVRHLALDIAGNIWTYMNEHLIVIRATNMDPMLDITDNDNDFLHTLSPNKLYQSCWYTNKAQNKVINLDLNGTEVCSIPMTKPTFIISIPDGGCFVLDDLESKIYKLTYDGTILSSFSIDSAYTVNYLEVENTELEPRFLWLLVNNVKVVKINVDGTVDGEVITPSATSIQTFPGGCLVESSSEDDTYQIDVTLNIVKTWSFSGYHLSNVCGNPAYATYNDILQNPGTGLQQRTGELIWGDSTDDWYEVNTEENTLPLKKHHQVKLKLQADAGADTPIVNKILIPEPAKITGIQAQESKPVYIKTDFPATAENKIYNVKLRCWWGNKEE